MATEKRKINYKKIVLITLAFIGSITVIDNTYRLGRELGNSIINTVHTHKWGTHITK